MNPNSLIANKQNAMIEGIDRSVFRELLHSTFDIVTEEALMERIFCTWDKGFEGLPLRLEGWICGLSIFLKGTPAEKTAFCFRVYDLNGDNFITRDEMFTLLRWCQRFRETFLINLKHFFLSTEIVSSSTRKTTIPMSLSRIWLRLRCESSTSTRTERCPSWTTRRPSKLTVCCSKLSVKFFQLTVPLIAFYRLFSECFAWFGV